MLKRGLLGFILVCLLALTVSPAAAVPVSDLTALARFIPAEADIFASARIDDGYIGVWDGFARRLAALFPDDFPRTTLTEQLDLLSKPFGGDFQTVFRSWLGDTAAIAIIDYGLLLDNNFRNDSDAILGAVAITNAAGAEAYFDELNQRDGETAVKTRDENGILYEFSRGEIQSILIQDDVILFGNLSAAFNRMARLADSEGFADALTRLPETDYNILIYINYPGLSEAMLNSPLFGGAGADNVFELLFQTTGTAAFGFTILDGRSFTMDFTLAYDPAAIAEFYDLDPSLLIQRPFDPAFARFIPAGTPLVIFDNDLASGYQGALGQLASMTTVAIPGGSISADEVERALEQINFALRGATGLTLDELLGWMSGDFALWLGLSDAAKSAPNIVALTESNPIDFGLLVDASVDPDAAAAAARGLRRGFSTLAEVASGVSTRFSVTDETIGGVEVAVLTITDRNLPFPIQIMVGASADLLVLGTRGAVEAAFAPGAGLDTDPAFQEALRYSLAGAQGLAYASGLGFLPLIDALEAELRSDADTVRAVLSLLSSSSAATIYTDDSGLVRLVITVPE
jgi:hypothetical protein